MNRKEPSVTGRRCSRVARKDLLCGCSSIFRYQKPKLVLQKIKVGDVQLRECSGFESRNSHTRLHLSEDLVFEILVRLPAKSVARFRCVSSAWLTIATDPSFILAHARRAPISLLVSSILTINRNGCLFHNLLFSFSLRGLFCCKRRLDQISDSAISSLDGLVLFFRNKEHLLPSDSEYYVLNPLIGRRIDLPHLNRTSQKFVRTMDLYYHRWTGEYRVLNLNKCIEGPDTCHLDAAVLSLGGASSSWRQIKAKAPLGDLFHWHRQIQVNDRFYWTCLEFSDTPIILVFDILKETFSLMELPSYSQKSTFPSFAVGSCLKYGLVDMEGILCLWCVYIDKSCAKNVMIDIWAAADGDEKWKNTYSLCLVDEWGWALKYSDKNYQLEDFCFCLREKELLFLFNGRKSYPLMDKTKVYAQYLFYWDLKSDKYWTELLSSYFELLTPSAFLYKETLITTPFNQTIITDALE